MLIYFYSKHTIGTYEWTVIFFGNISDGECTASCTVPKVQYI